MSFATFDDFHQKFLKELIHKNKIFSKNFCDSLSVIISSTQVLRKNSLKLNKYLKQVVQAKNKSLKLEDLLYSNRYNITNDIQERAGRLSPTN